ncbi:MAG: hypothetical protein SVT56_11140 [Chloroflexota bacterium]|nr:hypothetical protein [Chloroflexota bacterium]
MENISRYHGTWSRLIFHHPASTAYLASWPGQATHPNSRLSVIPDTYQFTK